VPHRNRLVAQLLRQGLDLGARRFHQLPRLGFGLGAQGIAVRANLRQSLPPVVEGFVYHVHELLFVQFEG